MTTNSPSIVLAGANLGRYCHACAFFNSPEEEYRTLLPFIIQGIAQGVRAFHIVDPALRDAHLDRLRGAGIDVDRALQKRQLEVRIPAETYLRGEGFNQDAMIALIELLLRAGPSLGYPRTRLVAHAESALDTLGEGTDWLEYESRLNLVLPEWGDPVICVYDCRRLKAGMALDILRTHPVVILGGELHENPYFAPPADFLRELLARNARPQERQVQ